MLELVIQFTDHEERVPCTESVFGSELAYTRTRTGHIFFKSSGQVKTVRVERDGVVSAYSDFAYPFHVTPVDRLDVTWTMTFIDDRKNGGGVTVKT